MKRLLLIGGGGHARVVIDAARASGAMDVIAILDDRVESAGGELDGVPVVGPVNPQGMKSVGADFAFVAIGDCGVRSRIASALDGVLPWATVIHPSAWVSPASCLGAGVLIAAMAVIQPGADIGDHVIVNTAASVDHDSRVERFAHVGPGVRLCGGTHVGEGALVGVGAAVAPGVRIGNGAVVGAGAVAVSDIPPGSTAVGVPARPR